MNDFPIQNPNLPADKQDIDNIRDEEETTLFNYHIEIGEGEFDPNTKYFDFIATNVEEAFKKLRKVVGDYLRRDRVLKVKETIIKR